MQVGTGGKTKTHASLLVFVVVEEHQANKTAIWKNQALENQALERQPVASQASKANSKAIDGQLGGKYC